MLAIALCKTLLAMAACWGMHVTVTPPHRPRKDGEANKGVYEFMFVWSAILLKVSHLSNLCCSHKVLSYRLWHGSGL